MKKLIACAWLLMALQSYGQQVLSKEEYTPLFNGENWDGWYLKIRSGDPEEANRVFAIEDGMIHVFKNHPDSFNLNQGNNKTHGLFYTEKKYSMYSFRFEYKWGDKIMNNFDQFQYDAGLYYHVYNDKIWPFGLEYQIRYDHTKNENHTGDYWASTVQMQWYADENGRAALPKNGGVTQEIKGGEHLAKIPKVHHALDGEWNQCEVIVMADQYSIHKLNGEIVNYATDFDQKEGVIGLQSETAEIYYRNLEIREFDQFVPANQFFK
ncbi:3-keto-disaccharide hydrolase [Reichenbachiella ulvae]|uniref:DUF1080 domain-containing protein n=1 Tax=Reichenbachiella ulvae TaxID=2980104 RepID=A0ABT3CZZ9_9BACT|nr:DUF1080 domain-containing protein [Reichenbachiella ulvae]MCV9389276.1 DUF1080 domain-containing protein [Reichenbachiella ulvae]